MKATLAGWHVTDVIDADKVISPTTFLTTDSLTIWQSMLVAENFRLPTVDIDIDFNFEKLLISTPRYQSE